MPSVALHYDGLAGLAMRVCINLNNFDPRADRHRTLVPGCLRAEIQGNFYAVVLSVEFQSTITACGNPLGTINFGIIANDIGCRIAAPIIQR